MRKALVLRTGLLWAMTFLSLVVTAQNTTLSSSFFTKLSAQLTHSGTPSEQSRVSALLPRLKKHWDSGYFSAEQQRSIQNVVQNMHARRVPAFPYLYQYLYDVNLIAETHRKSAEFVAWQRYVSAILRQRRLVPLRDFLLFSENLLQKQILFSKATSSWHFRQAAFSLHFDTTFYVRFSRLNLIKSSRNDSLVILHTKGRYYYASKKWQGDGGVLQWVRAVRDAKMQYTLAGSYRFSLKTNIFHIDSVRLTYPVYLKKQAVLGRLSDRVLSGRPGKNSVYPHFISYSNRLSLPGIYPQIAFHGAIEVAGDRFYGATVAGRRPEIILKRFHKPVLRLLSQRFDFHPDEITSGNVNASLYVENDSIYHPRLQLRYEAKTQRLQLYTLSDKYEEIPFFDSYHKMELYVPSLVWNVKTDSILFKKIRGLNDKQPARFESDHYFDVREFYALQGIDEINPLYVVQNFIRTYSTRRISVDALSSFMNKDPRQAEDLLMALSNKGFVVYDSDTKTAMVTQRLHYFLDAKAGRTDYDVIHFNSEEKLHPNASLNLKDLKLHIYDVPRIFISDSQQVYIYPYHKRIAVGKNRNFSFSGKVSAGLFNFYTRQSTFVYDSFMIKMNAVDSLSFGVWKKDRARNKWFVVHVRQAIQKLQGKLYVDLPFNKSGLMHVAKYPEFVSQSESYVYYNRRSIQDSTLLPGRFFYRVAPFVFDSLMTFNTKHLAFQGSLVSDSVFAPLRAPLQVMPDYSLGFVYKTPAEGLPVYRNEARFYDTLFLDMQGFYGRGKLSYLTTTVQSKDFRFYPDSLIAAHAQSFQGSADSVKFHFPPVFGKSVAVNWNLLHNVMRVTSLGAPFKIYRHASFRGVLALSSKKFSGKGNFTFGHSNLISSYFTFTYRRLDADTARFVLRNQETGDTTFLVKNYRTNIDFKEQKGWFQRLDNQLSYMKFPFNGYISTLDQVQWLMNQDRLSFYSAQDKAYLALDSLNRKQWVSYRKPGPEFISTQPDSLRFYAEKAFYNISKYTIDVKGVKLIKIADAAIFPKHETVTILPKGKLATIDSAEIWVDTATFYHKIYDARVNILSKEMYSASGKLDYKDRNGTAQPIFMKDIHVNGEGRSVATGTISKKAIFFLSPEYFFAGKVNMHAGDSLLHFKGGYQLNENCVDNTGNWMALDQDVDPRHLAFRFDSTARTADSLKAWFGLGYSFKYHDYYPLVLQALKDPGDQVLIAATGKLGIDRKTGNIWVGKSKNQQNANPAGNFIELEAQNCQMKGEGTFNMGLKNPTVETRFIGHFKHDIEKDSTVLHVVMIMNFHFEPTALTLMADSLRLIPATRVDVSDGLYSRVLKNMLGPKKGQEILNQLAIYGKLKRIPSELNKTLIFNDLHLVWDPISHSFLSQGPIGVGSVGENTLNKYMNGILQIKRNRSQASIELLLFQGSQWYYFKYANDVMMVRSSDPHYNEIIDAASEEKRTLNPESSQQYYEYVLAPADFVGRFRRAMKHLGRLK
jgi:hypothetical protein